jgi:HlyD family secretion protein
MRRLIKWLLVLGVLGGIAFGIQSALAWYKTVAKPIYRTARVTRGRIESAVNSTGTVKPVRTVLVGAFVSGPIAEVLVDFNSRVKKDEILARIDTKLLKAALERDKAALLTQQADLARIEALLQQAKNNEMRARKLRAINPDYLSDTEMDQYRYTRESTEAQRKLALAMIEQAKANLETSKANLGYAEIQSPVDGVVIERKVDPGQTVAASFQTPELFTVAPEMDKHMYVFASVDEADVGLIRDAELKKKPVRFTVDAYPQDLFEGTIHQVRKNSTTTQNVVTYPVVILAKNPDLKLMPGMTANISFVLEAREDVLRVPAAAFRYVPPLARVAPEDRHYLEGVPTEEPTSGVRLSASSKVEQARKRSRRVVWVVQGDFLRGIPITLGLGESQYAELLEGNLEEGQEIVTGTDSPASRGQ